MSQNNNGVSVVITKFRNGNNEWSYTRNKLGEIYLVDMVIKIPTEVGGDNYTAVALNDTRWTIT